MDRLENYLNWSKERVLNELIETRDKLKTDMSSLDHINKLLQGKYLEGQADMIDATFSVIDQLDNANKRGILPPDWDKLLNQTAAKLIKQNQLEIKFYREYITKLSDKVEHALDQHNESLGIEESVDWNALDWKDIIKSHVDEERHKTAIAELIKVDRELRFILDTTKFGGD